MRDQHNMKLLILTVLVTILRTNTAAVLKSCPISCKCENENELFKVKCASQKFLHKLNDKQALRIESLDLSNSSIATLDKKLKKLKNLQHLNLSNNRINRLKTFPNFKNLRTLLLSKNQLEDISFSILPKSLEDLDISSNFIKDMPKDWNVLHRLSFLHIQNNPINCDETALNQYVSMVSLKINITESTLCQYPKNLNGKKLQSQIAEALLNPMLGDQESITENEEEVESSEFIRHNPENSERPLKKLHEDLFEGSGDEEGSGDSDKIIIPSACTIDCTTFKPLEPFKENNTSPLLSIKEQFGILVEDLFGKEQEVTTAITPPVETEKPSTVVEEKVPKKSVTLPTSEIKTTKTTEKLVVGNKNNDNLERASLSDNEDTYTYYLIGVVLLLMVIVMIFIVIKKKINRNKMNRRRNSMGENGVCEEMKPLGKYKEISNGTNNEKQKEDETTTRPERVPLMNGHNGDKPSSMDDSLEELDVTLRKPLEDSNSPKLERVTVTAGEILPSILKTPQLIHRELNSDGEIVTKALNESY